MGCCCSPSWQHKDHHPLSTVPPSNINMFNFPQCQMPAFPGAIPGTFSVKTAAASSHLPWWNLYLDFSRPTPWPAYYLFSFFIIRKVLTGLANTSSFPVGLLRMISVVPRREEAPAHFTVEATEAPRVARLIQNHILWASERWIWEQHSILQPLSLFLFFFF